MDDDFGNVSVLPFVSTVESQAEGYQSGPSGAPCFRHLHAQPPSHDDDIDRDELAAAALAMSTATLMMIVALALGG